MRLVRNGVQTVVASITSTKPLLGMLLAGGLLLGATGCQSEMYTQNQDLARQNRELQANLQQKQPTPDTSKYDQELQAQDARIRDLEKQLNERPPQQASYTPGGLGGSAATGGGATATPNFGQGIEVRQDVAAGTITVNLPGDVLFDSGRATLTESAKTTLNKVVAVLKKDYSGKMIRVNGHTDSDPIMHSAWKSNQELSQARALAVAHYLESQGVTSSRVKTEGLGDSQPRSNTDKRLNRRVEIVVLTRESGPADSSSGASTGGTHTPTHTHTTTVHNDNK